MQLEDWQYKRLYAQKERKDDLNQYAIVHIKDRIAGWDIYLLNPLPDNHFWAIVDGVDLSIEPIDLLTFADINYIFFEGINIDRDFLPIRAKELWETLKAKRALMKR